MSDVLEESQLHKLIEFGPALVSELDLEPLLDRLLETARSITGARYAALGILDDERRELERFVTRGLSDEEERVIGDRPLGRGVLGLLIEDPVPLRIADLNAHPSSFGVPIGHPPMRTFLGVPIVIRGRAWGNLYLTEKAAGEFSEADEQAVTTLAAWASIAIEHARVLEAAADRQGQLETAVKRLEATQAVAVAVGAETEIGRVLELITKRARAMIGARSLLILLRAGDDLVIASGAGYARARIGARIPVADSTSGEVMLLKRATRVADPASRLRISPERLGVTDAQFALLVPLFYRGEALGVMAAFDRGKEGPEFGAEDEQLLVAFAASAATAVATAQTVRSDRLKHSLDAAEAERKRWARELHDETLQALASMKVLASAARRAGDPERMRTALAQLADGLEEQIDTVHTVISELRPAALDDLGLRPAIEALAERHAAVPGAEVVCELELPDPVEGTTRLAPEVETTVYRLVQEALTNVAKHAEAGSVRVAVSASNGSLTVEIVDDGTGFDVSGPRAGFGLTGMRERVTLAGGSLTVDSGSQGTAIRATLPAPA
jgi:signal transduction histidine kinase